MRGVKKIDSLCVQPTKMKKLLVIAVLIFGAGLANAQQKIGHLNSQEVMAAMPSYQSAVKQLETFQADGAAEIQMMIADYDKAVKKYMAERETLSPVRQQMEEEKLGKKEQAINEREESLQREVEAYSRELNQPIITKFNEAVKIVSDRSKYEYVFDISMLMVHTGPDLTKEVITEVVKLENAPKLVAPVVKP